MKMHNAFKKSLATALGVAILPALISGCGRPTNQSAAITGSSLQGGCIPISEPIPFTATNATVDTMKFEAGILPNYNGRSIGEVTLGGTVAGGTFQRAGNDGQISMEVTMNQYNQGQQLPGSYYYGQSAQATLTGVLQLSGPAQARIRQTVLAGMNSPYYNGYSGGYGTSLPQTTDPNADSTVCVSGLGLSLNRMNYSITSGIIYLYLNNSQYIVDRVVF